MATEVSEPVPSRRAYPWEQWCNGSTWIAEHGVDFDGDPLSFQRYLHTVAGRNGMEVETSRDGNKVTFKFNTPGKG